MESKTESATATAMTVAKSNPAVAITDESDMA